MLTLLDRLGDPEEIAVAASPPEATRSTTMEAWAIILLLLGGFVFLVGWLAGVVLLWSSSLWTRRDKLIGTLVIPQAASRRGSSCSSCSRRWAEARSAAPAGLPIGKNGSRHLVQATTHTTCHGGTSTAGTVGLLIALVILLVAPIATAIYLGRRLNRVKHTQIGDASAAIDS